jgi:hypothetical protein
MVKIKGDRSMFIYLAIIDSPEGKLKFEVIYERYKGLMFYTANSVLGDTRDSEDIVHDAFLKIIEIIDEIDDPKSPQTRYLIVTKILFCFLQGTSSSQKCSLTVSSLLYLIGKAAFRVECQFTVGYAFVVCACQFAFCCYHVI